MPTGPTGSCNMQLHFIERDRHLIFQSPFGPPFSHNIAQSVSLTDWFTCTTTSEHASSLEALWGRAQVAICETVVGRRPFEINCRDGAGAEHWLVYHLFIYCGNARMRDVQKQKQKGSV